MKESEVRRALEKIGVFVDDVKDVLDKQKTLSTDWLREYAQHGEAAREALASVCDYIVDGGELDLGGELQELQEEVCRLLLGEWGYIPNDDPDEERKGLFARIAIRLDDLLTEIERMREWLLTRKEAADAQGGEASASQQARVIDRKGIKAMFMKGSESQRKAEAFVVNLEKLAENGEKDKAFAMCAANMHKQLSHNALLPKFQAWAKLWRALKILIGATAKGYENQREKLLKEAKK